MAIWNCGITTHYIAIIYPERFKLLENFNRIFRMSIF